MLICLDYYADHGPAEVSMTANHQRVPVVTRDGSAMLCRLGYDDRKPDHSPGHYQSLPDGHTVPIDVLQGRGSSTLWPRYRGDALPVRLGCTGFRYQAFESEVRHRLDTWEYLEGAAIKWRGSWWVYLVVVGKPADVPAVPGVWWPRILRERREQPGWIGVERRRAGRFF